MLTANGPMATPPMATPLVDKKSGEIVTAIEMLQANVSTLSNTIDVLMARFAPVINYPPTAEDDSELRELEPNTQLSRLVIEQVIRIHDLNRSLNNMLDGCEI